MPVHPGGTVLELDSRADEAERSVTTLFGARLLGVPGTHLARVAAPAPTSLRRGPWHYWWQAHYLDAIVDAALRHRRQGDLVAARRLVRRGDRLLSTIRWRNGARFATAFYDDMAWLLLAVGRLRWAHQALAMTGADRRLDAARLALEAPLRLAATHDLGGGVFWNTARDLKNVAATAPWALHLARTGEQAAARGLVDWIYERLASDRPGLLADGVRLVAGVEQAVPDVYTYNQGSVLGALLALGDDLDMGRARGLVAGVDVHLRTRLGWRTPLRTHGGGDGGLFTGILTRYLSLAAGHPGLGLQGSTTARRLVLDTAQALWLGRDLRDIGGGRRLAVFSPDPRERAGEAPPAAVPLELSTQLQAWTVLEAAACTPSPRPPAGEFASPERPAC